MSKKKPILILEDSFKFKKGRILLEYSEIKEGIKVGNDFLPKKSFIQLNENLSPADEKRVKELIKGQLKYFFWQLYTKSNYMIGSI